MNSISDGQKTNVTLIIRSKGGSHRQEKYTQIDQIGCSATTTNAKLCLLRVWIHVSGLLHGRIEGTENGRARVYGGGGSYRWTEAALRMGPLWDWMTHPFTCTPPGITFAPAALSSAAVGPSHAAAEAICSVWFATRGCVMLLPGPLPSWGISQSQTGRPLWTPHLPVVCRPSDRIRWLWFALGRLQQHSKQ